MTQRLSIAIDNLYTVFSRYKSNPHMAGSPLYEHLDEWNSLLFSKPLRELTSADLSRFAGKVITTWGDTDDLKHFLPRLLELTALIDTPYEVEVLYHKVEMAGLKLWDSGEQYAVNQCSIAMWENLLLDNSDRAEWEFRSYFATLAHFYPRFDELTAIWMKDNSFSSIKHLTNYIYDEYHNLFMKKHNPGNEKGFLNIESFKGWLLSDSMAQKLTDAFYQFEQTAIAEKISWSLKIIEYEKRSAQAKTQT